MPTWAKKAEGRANRQSSGKGPWYLTAVLSPLLTSKGQLWLAQPQQQCQRWGMWGASLGTCNVHPPSQNICTFWLLRFIFDHSSYLKNLWKCKNNYDILEIHMMINHVIAKSIIFSQFFLNKTNGQVWSAEVKRCEYFGTEGVRVMINMPSAWKREYYFLSSVSVTKDLQSGERPNNVGSTLPEVNHRVLLNCPTPNRPMTAWQGKMLH
jgi:hypothetical protein